MGAVGKIAPKPVVEGPSDSDTCQRVEEARMWLFINAFDISRNKAAEVKITLPVQSKAPLG